MHETIHIPDKGWLLFTTLTDTIRKLTTWKTARAAITCKVEEEQLRDIKSLEAQ
jgi:hypothetical protein